MFTASLTCNGSVLSFFDSDGKLNAVKANIDKAGCENDDLLFIGETMVEERYTESPLVLHFFLGCLGVDKNNGTCWS